MNTTTTKKRPVGRPRADGKAPLSREAVFAVAAKLIATHGYVGASLRMIAEPLDARAPSISRMFGSKRHLLIELVKSLSLPSIRYHEQLAQMSLPPAPRLFKMVHGEVMAVASTNESLMAIFYLPELRQREFREALAVRQQMIGYYRSTIIDGIEQGVFHNVNPSSTAEQVFQVTETAIIATDRSTLGTPQLLADNTADLVLRGLLKRPESLEEIASTSQQLRLNTGMRTD